MENNHLHLMIYLLPKDQHLPTPAGSSPYDHDLHFPSITPNSIVGTPIGNGGMKNDMIGYSFASEHWGKGYATEAVAGILREIWRGAAKGKFGTLPKEADDNVHKGKEYIKATTHPENKASGRVLEKVGAVSLGIKEVDDWSQTTEEKEKEGVRKFTLQTYRVYNPGSAL